MKQILLVIIAFCLSSLPSLAQDKMLLGEISKSDLQQAPFSTWYMENESGYKVDAAAIEGLENLLEGVEIKIAPGMVADLYSAPDKPKNKIIEQSKNTGGMLSGIFGKKK